MSTELAIASDYPIVTASNVSNLLAGASPDDIQIGTVKFPSGGSTVWQIPTEGDQHRNAEVIEGVVINQYSYDVLYLKSFDEDPDAKPEAVWIAGKNMFATPDAVDAGVISGADVHEQPLNQWESDLRGGKGKAISNRWTIYLVEKGEMLPIRLSVPTMSRKTWFNFQMRAYMAKPSTSFVTSFSLHAEKNGAGQPYSEMSAKKTGELNDEAAAEYAALATALEPLTTYTPPAVTADVEPMSDEDKATVKTMTADSVAAEQDLPF